MSIQEYFHGLYGVTDSTLMLDDESLLTRVAAALAGGMRVLQYRDKSKDSARRLRQALALKQLCQQSNALFLINDDVDLAIACGADGVHLGQSDEALSLARARLGQHAVIGISCEDSLALARQAVEQGADYIAFGRFFASKTKPDAPLVPIHVLVDAKAAFSLPVVAIGGITVDNAPQLISAGANMLAVVNDLFSIESSKVITQRAERYRGLYHIPVSD